MGFKLKNTHIVIILLGILLTIYYFTSKPSEGFEDSATKSVVICKAEWCGHCKKAKPEFDNLLSASPIKLNDGTTATVKVLDADTDKEEIAKYNVKGYPTVLIQGKEFPGERTSSAIIDYLNTI
jgi:thiol-disulfide isomerase/thioredoxin